MYDLLTSAILFFLLAPGTLVTLPPGVSPYLSALTHAIVFYVVQLYLPTYVPNWGIWIAGGVVLLGQLYRSRSSSMGTETYGARRR